MPSRLETPKARRLKKLVSLILPDPGYYGWWVVAACILCGALTAPGQSFALALYMEPLAAAVGASRVEVATVYAWATLVAALLLPVAGRIADRSDSRWFLAGVVVCIALSLLLLSAVRSWLGLAIAFFALRLMGQGVMGLGVLTTVLRWFERHRARAVAIAVLGYAVGEFVMPSVIVHLQEALGWRGSLSALSVVYLLVFAPVIFLVVRSPASVHRGGAAPPVVSAALSTTASEAVRMPRFWLLAALVSVTPFVITGLLLNHVALFDRIGWTVMDVARALQGYAVASLFATYLTGTMLDRVPARWGVLLSMVLLTTALLLPLGVRSTPLGVLLYGAMLGAAAGATNAANGVLWPEYFGVASVGAIKGIVSTIRNGATAAATPLAAWMIHRDPGFSSVLVAGAVLAAAAACVALVLPPASGTRAAVRTTG